MPKRSHPGAIPKGRAPPSARPQREGEPPGPRIRLGKTPRVGLAGLRAWPPEFARLQHRPPSGPAPQAGARSQRMVVPLLHRPDDVHSAEGKWSDINEVNIIRLRRRDLGRPRMASNIRRSVLFSLFERNGSAVLGLVGTLILARLLTPSDFGIYSVSLSVVMIIDVIRDFGVGTYLVQERQLTKSVVQTVFTVSLVLSLACAGAILAITIPAAALYGEPRIVHVIALLSLTFLLSPLGTASTSLLRRDLEFGKL